LQERFSRAPYIQHNRGDDWGLVGFDKTLAEDEIAYVKENLKTLDSKDITWSTPEGL
jgi:lupus La protein